jgi:tetratricopeptide (TPR) repeat protein
MKHSGTQTMFIWAIRPALPLVLAALAGVAQAQIPLGEKCTGTANVPWSEQISGCTRAIESGRYTGKDLAKAFIWRSKAYAMGGDLDRGLADVEQAIRLDPNDVVALGARGDLHLVKKDYPQALADYDAAIAADPSSSLALVGRGIAFLATGDLDRAITDFDQATQMQPTLADAPYWRGIAKLRKGDKAAGEADIAAAKKLNPDVGR